VSILFGAVRIAHFCTVRKGAVEISRVQERDLGHPALFEEFLVDFFDFERLFYPASNIMSDHEARKLATVN